MSTFRAQKYIRQSGQPFAVTIIIITEIIIIIMIIDIIVIIID
jgi:hypothetical protein